MVSRRMSRRRRSRSKSRKRLVSCKKHYVRNSKSNRCIKRGGKIWRKKLMSGRRRSYRRSSRRSSRRSRRRMSFRPKSSYKRCKRNYIRNSKTRRCYKRGGSVWKKKVASRRRRASRRSSRRRTYSRRRSYGSPCPEGTIRNRSSGRCWTRGGSAWKRANPCPKHYVRNPDTLNCYKLGGPVWRTKHANFLKGETSEVDLDQLKQMIAPIPQVQLPGPKVIPGPKVFPLAPYPPGHFQAPGPKSLQELALAKNIPIPNPKGSFFEEKKNLEKIITEEVKKDFQQEIKNLSPGAQAKLEQAAKPIIAAEATQANKEINRGTPPAQAIKKAVEESKSKLGYVLGTLATGVGLVATGILAGAGYLGGVANVAAPLAIPLAVNAVANMVNPDQPTTPWVNPPAPYDPEYLLGK